MHRKGPPGIWSPAMDPPSPCVGRGRSESGFTLLELVISIAILALITSLTAGAMRLGFSSVDKGERRIESLERLRSSLNIIDSQIQSEIPITYTEEASKKFYFKGGRDFLQFTTNYSIWGGQKGYVLVAYQVITDPQGKEALSSSEDVIGVGGNRETLLLTSFDAIFFDYFYKGPTDEKGNWVDAWPDETSIPEKIRLHLIKGGDELSLLFPMRSRGSLASGAVTLVQ
jgi:prepilin-type N-terminal cleavage/methylation domain-containing protein